MELSVYNKEGKETGKVSAPDSVFGLPWNADLVFQVVNAQAANKRQGTAQARDRANVRGGGRKPWKQKGTGRARHGSIRSPIWKGGGVTHGPLAEKNYDQKVNKKMAKKALFTIFSQKAREGEVVVLDDLSFNNGKTKEAAIVFKNLSKMEPFVRMVKGNGVLVALHGKDIMARRAIKNLPFVHVDETRNLNAHEVAQYKFLMIPKGALESFGK
jgi:large subunit ribosomal protein L4